MTKGNYSIILCLVLLLVSSTIAQQIWSKVYARESFDFATSIVETTDGGFLVVGDSYHSGRSDIWIIRTDSDGDSISSRTYGQFQTELSGEIVQALSGEYFLAATKYSDLLPGNLQAWLLYLDEWGDTLWTKEYGHPHTTWANAITQTPDSCYLLGGAQQLPDDNSYEKAWIAKIEENGDTLWTHRYDGSNINRIVNDGLGGFLLCGHVQPYETNYRKVWIARIDESGDTLWTIDQIDDSETESIAMDISEPVNNTFLVVGWYETEPAGSEDRPVHMFISKYTLDGDLIWERSYGESTYDIATSIIPAAGGHYIVGGQSNSYGPGDVAAWLLRLNEYGDLMWMNAYGGEWAAGINAILQASDNHFIFGGYLYTNSYGYPNQDLWIFKTDSAGGAPSASINEPIGSPKRMEIVRAYPNPFNSSISIDYFLASSKSHSIDIFDINGRVVRREIFTNAKAGIHQYEWNGTGESNGTLPSGLYFIYFSSSSERLVRKVALVK